MLSRDEVLVFGRGRLDIVGTGEIQCWLLGSWEDAIVAVDVGVVC